MPYEWLVGLRYTRAGRRSGRNSFISFISLISVSGIAVGVAALIVVLSVMNGFRKDVTDRMLSVLAHIEVLDKNGEGLPDWQKTMQDAFKNPAVKGAAPFVQTQGMLLRDGVMRPAVIRGILPAEEPKVSDVAKTVKYGSLDALQPGQFNIVLGYSLARSMGLNLGDKVTMALAQAQVTPAGMVPHLHCGGRVPGRPSRIRFRHGLRAHGRRAKNGTPGRAVRGAAAHRRHAQGAGGGRRTAGQHAGCAERARLVQAEQDLVCRRPD
jgi:ABC-type lipoprotein release transport system permease subunit